MCCFELPTTPAPRWRIAAAVHIATVPTAPAVLVADTPCHMSTRAQGCNRVVSPRNSVNLSRNSITVFRVVALDQWCAPQRPGTRRSHGRRIRKGTEPELMQLYWAEDVQQLAPVGDWRVCPHGDDRLPHSSACASCSLACITAAAWLGMCHMQTP